MALGAAKKRVLIVSGEGVALFRSSSRGIEREAVLSWDVPNFDELLKDALTEQSRGDPVLILFDGADQTYRKEENIPKLSAFDRARFIKRKLEQSFPSYPVRTFIQIKPNGEKPFYLFVALPETDRLDNIANDMLETGVQLDNFGLLPVESAGLVQALSAKVFRNEDSPSRWSVLISQHEAGGLRQVIIKNGTLALTRNTPTSEAGVHGPGWADEVVREFKATLTYIARFGYTAEEGLDVMVVCSSIEKQFFSDKSLPVTNFKTLTPAEALFAIGAKGVSLGDSNFGDVLHAAWAAKKRTLAAPVVVPSLHRIMVPRKVARIASGVLALALVGIGFFVFSQYSDYSSLKQEVTESTQQKELLDHEYAQDTKAFDAYPVQPKVMKSMLTVKKSIMDNSFNITPVLNLLYQALSNDSSLKLSELSFEHDATAFLDPTKARAASHASSTPGAPPKNEHDTVKIAFRLGIVGNVDLEHKVLRALEIQKRLQQSFPGYTVTIVSQFGNVTSNGQFKGQTGDVQSPDAPAAQPDAAQQNASGMSAAMQQALDLQREMSTNAANARKQNGTPASGATKVEETAQFELTGPPL